MIFVRDKGRMCNNILQYGHLYAWGREHGRPTVSMRFAYKYRWFSISHSRHHSFLTYVVAKYGAKWGLLPVADFGTDAPATDYAAQEARLSRYHHIVAQGWYARWYTLFLKYKPEIIALFQFDAQVRRGPDRLLQSLGSRCPSCPSAGSRPLRIGLHIRRGDYRRWHGGRYCYTDEQYIGIVGSYIRWLLASGAAGSSASSASAAHIHLIVCGNDPDLDQSAFRRALPAVTIVFAKGNPAEDLYLLSECHRLIGAPSTFTLVASMYHDVPLYWIDDPTLQPTDAHFGHFDQLFQQIR